MLRLPSVLFASVLTALFAGCASGGDPSASEAETEDQLSQCTDAKLDERGRCRNANGSFASRSCCVPDVPAKRRSLDAYKCPAEGDAIKVAFFDADSTVRVSKSGSVSANGLEDVNVLPFAASEIARLRSEGYLIAIVSNQGGVQQRHVTFEVAEGALAFTAKQLVRLGGRIDYFDMADRNDDFRKPRTGMATHLDGLLVEKCGKPIDLASSLMVGDSGYKQGSDGPHPDGRPADDCSNSDRLFAENLGVPFHEPTDFLGWRKWDVFNIASEADLVALLERIDEEIAELAESGAEPERREALSKEVAGIRAVNSGR